MNKVIKRNQYAITRHDEEINDIINSRNNEGWEFWQIYGKLSADERLVISEQLNLIYDVAYCEGSEDGETLARTY